MHLKILRPLLDDLEQTDLSEVGSILALFARNNPLLLYLIPKIRPLMHVVCLIWSRSKYYNTPVRIIVLLREMCNFFIGIVRSFNDISQPAISVMHFSIQTCLYLSPEDILKGELDESVDKVAIAIKVLKAFRDCYDYQRTHMASYFKVKVNN